MFLPFTVSAAELIRFVRAEQYMQQCRISLLLLIAAVCAAQYFSYTGVYVAL